MSVVVIADIKNKKINPATAEIISAAKSIAATSNIPVYIIVPFGNVWGDSYCASEFETYIIDMDIEEYSAHTLVKYIATVIKKLNGQFIIGLHTPFTIDFLPALSFKLNAQCYTQIHSISVDNNILLTRGNYSGKLNQNIIVNSTPVVFSVLPGSFEPYINSETPKKDFISIHISDKDKLHKCDFITQDSKDTSMDDAEVIIGAGKGVGSKENLSLLYEFAKIFPHSAVGGSRIVCDLGWLPYSKQIGITGKSITPKVYIACAISGSSQHTAGIKGAKTVIAINKDPYAPIFNVSHYGIVADIFEFIPKFIDYVKNNT
ncbi:MAG: electron transfer flavoprotein subunit alpha/FixB family protein [Spirochaetes bacterium]|nr:electron transfer flavoprotein subunit alpha/FixB family protein [Spirochaetota bacterium]